jgi:hypothetical protein
MPPATLAFRVGRTIDPLLVIAYFGHTRERGRRDMFFANKQI